MSSEKESQAGNRSTIAFIVPYPVGIAPGQRFQFEHYLPALKGKGFKVELYPFLNSSTHTILYRQGYAWQKFLGVIAGYWRRLIQLPRVLQADWIFIYREATPLGPPVIEWILGRLLRKKIIYDFDDAIWLPAVSKENRWIAWLKFPGKVKFICSVSYMVSVGNRYLADFAKTYASLVQLNPTVLETGDHHPKERQSVSRDIIRLGWTGSHSTLPYLKLLEPVLQQIEKRYPHVELMVIADRPADLKLSRLSFCAWSKATEVDDLNKIDIGIMPLPNDPWSLGKCGFKALQYMSMGIPTVASAVGANIEIIEQGVQGYLCSDDEAWVEALGKLIEQPVLRRQLGEAGRQRVIARYSVSANADLFCRMFTNSSINPNAIK